MLKVGAVFVAAVILVSGTTPIVPAAPASAAQNSAVGLCRDVLLPARPASNLGECLSYINTAQNQSDGEASHFCDFLIENDPDIFELMFVSRSECVRAYGQRGPWK